MASTNKTAHGLNAWVETDIPAMEDFNADNVIIDEELKKRAPLASPTLTGTPTAPTAAVGTNTTQIATTAFVIANKENSGYAPLTSPAFIGTPTAPTAASTTNSTQIATTAFVKTAVNSLLPLTGGTVTGSLYASGASDVGTSQVRNIAAGTAAPTASSGGNGSIYLQYS